MRKILTRLAAAAAILGLALGTAGAAGALTHPAPAVSGVLRFTHAGTAGTNNPVAGYFASTRGGGYFTHIEGYVGSNNSNSLNQLAVGGTNGGGLGLCNQTTGKAAQAGDVYLGGSLMNVDFGIGTLTGGPGKSDFGDRCADGTVGVTGTLLAGVPITDTIVVQILYNPLHNHNGCPAGDAVFEAEDITSNPGVVANSGCVPVGFGLRFTEADAGVVADTTSMSAPAVNLLVAFAHIGLSENLNGGGSAHGSFQASSHWTAFPVDSTGTGNGPVSAALLAVTAFSADHFMINAGTPTG